MTESGSKKQKKGRVTEKFLLAMLIIQIAFMVYMNVFHCDMTVDYDSSSAFVHEMEMGRQGKLLPEQYVYQNTLDLDSSVIISAIIYRITGNIFISRGIANCVMIAIYLIVIHGIFRRIGVSKEGMYTGMIIFFIPFSLEMLGYCKMMFAGAGFYAVRALIPVMMYSVLMEKDEKGKKASYISRIALLMICSFLSGLGSGVYVLMCALVPALVWIVIYVFMESDIRKLWSRRTVISLTAAIMAVAGMISQKMAGMETRADRIMLADDKSFFDNFFSAIAGIFTFFDGLTPRKDVKLVSVNTVSYLINFAVILGCLTAFLYIAVKSLKSRKLQYEKGYAYCVIAVNLAVFVFADLTYADTIFEGRYHLIPMMLVFLTVPEALDKLMNGSMDLTGFQKNTLRILISALLLAALFIGDVKWMKLKNKPFVKDSIGLHETIETMDVDIVYYIGDDRSLGRSLRVYSEETNYVTLRSDATYYWDTIYGGSSRYIPGTKENGRTAIISTEEVYASIPDERKEGMVLKTSYNEYNIYVAETNPFSAE